MGATDVRQGGHGPGRPCDLLSRYSLDSPKHTKGSDLGAAGAHGLHELQRGPSRGVAASPVVHQSPALIRRPLHGRVACHRSRQHLQGLEQLALLG